MKKNGSLPALVGGSLVVAALTTVGTGRLGALAPRRTAVEVVS